MPKFTSILGALVFVGALYVIGTNYATHHLEPAYTEPPPEFLSSKIATPYGANNYPLGDYSVERFTEILSKKKQDNGTFPEILGWSREDNVYTLHVLIKRKPDTYVFTHMLNIGDGEVSMLHGGVTRLGRVVRQLY